MYQVLDQLGREDREGFFAEPVPVEYALHTQYHSVVDQPMDFATMRGKVKRPFEFKFEVSWEVDVVSDLASASTSSGVLTYQDVSPAASGADKPVVYERTSQRKTAALAPSDEEVVLTELDALCERIDEALGELVGDLANK